MKLPNMQYASVPLRKVTDYFLSDIHPMGRRKAELFSRFGFSLFDPDLLCSALFHHAVDNDAAEELPSIYGRKFIVEGPMWSPDGRLPVVRTVWIIETGDNAPRLTTADLVDVESRSES
jgi:hypothetical protein